MVLLSVLILGNLRLWKCNEIPSLLLFAMLVCLALLPLIGYSALSSLAGLGSPLG